MPIHNNKLLEDAVLALLGAVSSEDSADIEALIATRLARQRQALVRPHDAEAFAAMTEESVRGGQQSKAVSQDAESAFNDKDRTLISRRCSTPAFASSLCLEFGISD